MRYRVFAQSLETARLAICTRFHVAELYIWRLLVTGAQGSEEYRGGGGS
jgi:hypothetical protein